MSAYYNECDPKAAAWLRELIKAGIIAPGDVDKRSIEDVIPAELSGYTQCHFFAGIGVWSYALRCAGWPDDRPVWTGSCPCQPFSAAGKRAGVADERHLWPAFYHIISQCRPDVIFGEQVASNDGLAWLDIVSSDLEAAGYAVGTLDLCAAGFGAPHIRQRLFFVADAENCDRRSGERGAEAGARTDEERWQRFAGRGSVSQLADAAVRRLPLRAGAESGRWQSRTATNGLGEAGGFWRDAEWVYCRDGKYRPVEPGTFPLAHGSPARMGRLRGYGNAVVAPVAEAFIRAYMDARSV